MGTKSKVVRPKQVKVQREIHNTIRDCRFVGVEFNPVAVEAVSVLANAALENAKALSTLAHVFRASGVTIETMVQIIDEPSLMTKKGAK